MNHTYSYVSARWNRIERYENINGRWKVDEEEVEGDKVCPSLQDVNWMAQYK